MNTDDKAKLVEAWQQVAVYLAGRGGALSVEDEALLDRFTSTLFSVLEELSYLQLRELVRSLTLLNGHHIRLSFLATRLDEVLAEKLRELLDNCPTKASSRIQWFPEKVLIFLFSKIVC